MATVNLIQIKRTSVAGRAANTTTLVNPGELALNMADRILYSTDGTTVFEIGGNVTNLSVSSNLVVGNSTVNTAVNSTAVSLANSTSSITITVPTAADKAAATKYLNANGSYVVPAGSGSPGGSNTFLQFNDSGAFNGIANLTFDKVSGILSLGNSTVNNTINSTAYSGSLISGNSTVNSVSNSISETFSIATSQMITNATTLFIGNSTVNSIHTSTTLSLANSTSNLTITIPTASDKALGTKYLNANGSYVVPAGGGGGVQTYTVGFMVRYGAFTP